MTEERTYTLPVSVLGSASLVIYARSREKAIQRVLAHSYDDEEFDVEVDTSEVTEAWAREWMSEVGNG
tara:strand:+ start:102 stop:305 length:204 start_codon:yes stop_codon:yes gene_type:complete